MAQFLTIGCHLECAIQTELVVDNGQEAISSISAQFYQMPERYERVRVGWHCAKVKGHVELKKEKPRVRTFSYDHSSPNSFGANVPLTPNLFKNG